MEFVGFTLRNNLFVAPMAGVTDRPFRQLCKKMGAGLAVSEMVTSNSLLYGSAKTLRRANHTWRSRADLGADRRRRPGMMAEAARHNVANGAQIIDINMGCPAKKVCNVMAGSALMQDEPLVGRILDAVVGAVPTLRSP
jgi:tRNA-dihydrouridine synthase B